MRLTVPNTPAVSVVDNKWRSNKVGSARLTMRTKERAADDKERTEPRARPRRLLPTSITYLKRRVSRRGSIDKVPADAALTEARMSSRQISLSLGSCAPRRLGRKKIAINRFARCSPMCRRDARCKQIPAKSGTCGNFRQRSRTYRAQASCRWRNSGYRRENDLSRGITAVADRYSRRCYFRN